MWRSTGNGMTYIAQQKRLQKVPKIFLLKKKGQTKICTSCTRYGLWRYRWPGFPIAQQESRWCRWRWAGWECSDLRRIRQVSAQWIQLWILPIKEWFLGNFQFLNAMVKRFTSVQFNWSQRNVRLLVERTILYSVKLKHWKMRQEGSISKNDLPTYLSAGAGRTENLEFGILSSDAITLNLLGGEIFMKITKIVFSSQILVIRKGFFL